MESEFLILGAGVTGLAAGVVLKNAALILEKEDRPGGLVRSKCFNGGYWFDNVLHLLHFGDEEIKQIVSKMMGSQLTPCPPDAWIETHSGILKYPFQFNLGALDEKSRNRCLVDYAKSYYGVSSQKPHNYKEHLLMTFGNSMCELFYFPYNEKLYKYPLELISCSEIMWNLHQPSFEDVLKGCFDANKDHQTYNSNAFYPRPPKGAPVRGMENLSIALAKKSSKIELNCTIVKIDPISKTVYTLKDGREKAYTFTAECLSTLPLPLLINMCSNAPQTLKDDVNTLRYTNVVSVGIAIKGPRPKNTGLWRYYTDRNLPFTRLIFMTVFDPLNAPEEGWSLLAEVTVSETNQQIDYSKLEREVMDGLYHLKLIDKNSEVVGVNSWINEPAYVVFTFDTEKIIKKCINYLKQYGITSIGRYGSWEYSSMFKNIKDGFSCAHQFLAK